MKLNQHLKDWKQTVSQRFPNLSLPQISGLATWSFGMVMTQSSSLTRVSSLIAKINGEKENTVRQRLKEWYKEGTAKARTGNKRVSRLSYRMFGLIIKMGARLITSRHSRTSNRIGCNQQGAKLYSSLNQPSLSRDCYSYSLENS